MVQRMGWTTWITAAITAVMLVVAGCGDSGEDDARDVAERFKDALLDPAGDRACLSTRR